MTITEPFSVGGAKQRDAPWRVLAGADRTGGRAMFGDGRIPPRSGPARHVHSHEDQAIYVVPGAVTVEVGGLRFEASAWCGCPDTYPMRSPTCPADRCGPSE